MEKDLERQKMLGKIDFIKVASREFILRDLESGVLSEIFYDNKYRQDTPRNQNTFFEKWSEKLRQYGDGLTDIGIYNTRTEYNHAKKILDFINNKFSTD